MSIENESKPAGVSRPDGVVAGVVGRKEKVWVNQKLYDFDFSERDLTHADFRGCTLANCNFDGADLAYANFEGANCYRSTFRRTRLYQTNFRNAVLAKTVMAPRDMFGIAISVTCDTFDGMEMSTSWKLCWLYELLLTKDDALNEKIKAVMISEMGEERFKGLQRVFKDRQI